MQSKPNTMLRGVEPILSSPKRVRFRSIACALLIIALPGACSPDPHDNAQASREKGGAPSSNNYTVGKIQIGDRTDPALSSSFIDKYHSGTARCAVNTTEDLEVRVIRIDSSDVDLFENTAVLLEIRKPIDGNPKVVRVGWFKFFDYKPPLEIPIASGTINIDSQALARNGVVALSGVFRGGVSSSRGRVSFSVPDADWDDTDGLWQASFF